MIEEDNNLDYKEALRAIKRHTYILRPISFKIKTGTPYTSASINKTNLFQTHKELHY